MRQKKQEENGKINGLEHVTKQKKDRINARRQTLHQIHLDMSSTNGPSSSNPSSLQLPIPHITLQNQHPLVFLVEHTIARNDLRSKLDSLKNMSTCVVCMEKYPRIKTKQYNGNCICYRCISEKLGHRFFITNNTDPSEQPICLQRLTQVEEMLIAKVSPVLQVTYARGGQ